MAHRIIQAFGICYILATTAAYADHVSSNACNTITRHYKEWKLGGSEGPLLVDPDVGFRCLKSSSINNTLAYEYLSEIIRYTQFQSTLTSLKGAKIYTRIHLITAIDRRTEPPDDFFWPATDLVGELKSIQNNVSSGLYDSQYEVDIDVAKVWASAHDGHFHTATCTSAAISFQRSVSLVSVSSDGVKDPLVYVYDDIVGLKAGSARVSNVVSIDGQDVMTFLKSESFFNFADPDSAWNYLFWNTARDPETIPLSSTFKNPTKSTFNWYPGNATILGYANGTYEKYRTHAVIDTDSWDESITNGESFFQYFCVPPAADTAAPSKAQQALSSTTTKPTAPAATPRFAHPAAMLQDPYGLVAGYELDGPGYEDVAVLWLSQFLSFTGNSSDPTEQTNVISSFKNITRQFLADSVSAGKKRLVLDVSGNLGGYSHLPYEVFGRLFPNAWSNVQFHANYELSPPVKMVTESFGAIPIEQMLPLSNESQSEQQSKLKLYYNDYNYHSWEDVDGYNFSSLSEFAPPIRKMGANYTATFQLPLNNTNWDQLWGGLVPFGYGENTNLSYQQPFEDQNVVVLSDGTCASACAVLLHLLAQLNIKTIAIGGLPGGRPMQAIGGTKGDQAAEAEQVQEHVRTLMKLNAISNVRQAQSILPGLVPLPLGDIHSTSVVRGYGINTRNHLLPNDTIPSMMRFEPADCHVYYTPENVADVQHMWRDAVDIAWNGRKCASGGFRPNNMSTGL